VEVREEAAMVEEERAVGVKAEVVRVVARGEEAMVEVVMVAVVKVAAAAEVAVMAVGSCMGMYC